MFAIILNLQLVAWNIYKLIKLKPHCEICFLEDICKSYIYSVHIHVHVIEKNRVFLHKDISIHTCAWHWKKIRLSFIKLFYKFHSTCNCYRKRGLISQTLTIWHGFTGDRQECCAFKHLNDFIENRFPIQEILRKPPIT